MAGRRRSVRRTRVEQVWWPELGTRKADVLDYYGRIARVLVPHLRNRPFTLKQHYNGPRSPFRWIKDAPPELPAWIRVSPQPAKSRGGELVRYPLVNDESALLWLVDYGCIDQHVWTSRIDRPDRPDVVLFDLDPAGVPFTDVAAAALLLREALDLLDLACEPMTTGGAGMHVRVPIARGHTHEQVRDFAGVVAGALARSSGGLVTVERSPARRHGVFVDVKMNGHGQQVVAPYSLRPVAAAAVATPLRWEEVDGALDPAALGMRPCSSGSSATAISPRRCSPGGSGSARRSPASAEQVAERLDSLQHVGRVELEFSALDRREWRLDGKSHVRGIPARPAGYPRPVSSGSPASTQSRFPPA